MDYKVIITPRKLCDAGMEALAAQANYEVVAVSYTHLRAHET